MLDEKTKELLAAVAVGQQVRRGASTKMDRFAARHLGGENVPEPAAGSDCR